MSPPTLRPERAGDEGAIDDVLREAFGGTDEVRLVRALRADDALALSLVAESDDRLLGHIAFCALRIDPEPGFACWALAPLAIRPPWQRRGIGAALTRAGLARAQDAGVGFVAVLGDPAYYTRFGFQAEAAAALRAPWSGPHFMGLVLPGGAPPNGEAIYPPAFGP